MGAIIYCFNLNISPSMSYGMLQCDIAVTELHAYDFVIKDFVIKKGHYLCWTCVFNILICVHIYYIYYITECIKPMLLVI